MAGNSTRVGIQGLSRGLIGASGGMTSGPSGSMGGGSALSSAGQVDEDHPKEQ